jgi:predicted AAA+ superfamily ATPase
LQNQSESFKIQVMDRHYRSLLNEFLKYFPCVVIIGPRQCGKTTLMNTLGTDWSYFDLEKVSDFESIERDPDLFFRLNTKQIAIDEAQLLPPLFSALRVAIDANRGEKGRFVITGSSSPELVESITESLAGRVGIIEMAPFSFLETRELPAQFVLGIVSGDLLNTSFLKALNSNSGLADVIKYWLRGGYPEPWLANNPRFSDVWMDNYVTQYLRRDIKGLFPGINENRFRKFLTLMAGISGQVINYSEVGRSLDVTQPTVKDYFWIAHNSFLWRTVQPFERDVKKRIVKHPRGHMRDSGVLNHLLRIKDENALLSSLHSGRLWEAMVTEEIIRNLNVEGISFDYFYYRTSAGAEVDLILDGDFGLVPIEIKLTQRLRKRDLRPIVDFIGEHDCKYGIVISNAERPSLIAEKVVELPFSYL